jgi:predicted dinucleotide-binding enzyme
MVNPERVTGEHVVFVAGNDADAKATVSGLLSEFGWGAGRIVDLGDLSAARGTEGFLLLWLRIAQAYGTYDLNITVLRS